MQEFEEIYAEHYTLIFKYAMSLCGRPSLAEEITQEAFFKAFRRIGSFRGDCRISSWLCRIAKNCYLDHVRREQKRIHEAGETQSGESPEALLVRKETAQDVHKALHRLREPYKEVFWLKTFGELSCREIGELFGKSESWGRVTYYRAKMMIREEME